MMRQNKARQRIWVIAGVGGEGVLPYMERVVGKGYADEVTLNLT